MSAGEVASPGHQTERDGGARAYAALLGWLARASAWASRVEVGAGQRWGGLLLGLQDKGSRPRREKRQEQAGWLVGLQPEREREGVKFLFCYFKTYFKYEPNQI